VNEELKLLLALEVQSLGASALNEIENGLRSIISSAGGLSGADAQLMHIGETMTAVGAAFGIASLAVTAATGAMVKAAADWQTTTTQIANNTNMTNAQMAQMHHTVPAPGLSDAFPGARYGLGIIWIADSCGGFWSHAGDVPGMSTINGISPDGKRVVVLSLTTELADPASELAIYKRAHRLIDDTLCQ